MKLHIATIVLDGMRFLPAHFMTFNRLNVDWHWSICEGVALNIKDTSWCKTIPPRYSVDGTTNYIRTLHSHPRISTYQKTQWPGKVAMFDAMLSQIKEPCVLMQIDADEMWRSEQLELIVRLFEEDDTLQCCRFYCRYFVGLNLMTKGEDCYGANISEWLRAWRFTPGQRFLTHEPPRLAGCIDAEGRRLDRDTTRNMDLIFDHYAWAYEEQVRFKETFYGYPDAVKHWRRLQAHKGPWPVQLKSFLPWVDDKAQAAPLYQ